MKRTALLATTLLAIGTMAEAGELKPEHVAADAKWVLHLDFEALRTTALAEQFREDQQKQVEQFREFLQTRYGIDPREDFEGVTCFSNSYEPHSGAMIIYADYDTEKVKALITQQPGAKGITGDGQAIFSIPLQHKAAPRTETPRTHHDGNPTHAFVLLKDGKQVVCASSLEQLQSAVKVLQGEKETLKDLGKDSPLLTEMPEGIVLYGTAKDFQEIDRRDFIFPILSRHERAVMYAGEHEDQAFQKLTLVSASAEDAEETKQGLQGLIDFAKVWAGDNKALRQLIEETEISVDEKTLTVERNMSTSDFADALVELRNRMTGRQEHRTARPAADEKD